jgi:hypothetical protein
MGHQFYPRTIIELDLLDRSNLGNANLGVSVVRLWGMYRFEQRIHREGRVMLWMLESICRLCVGKSLARGARTESLDVSFD